MSISVQDLARYLNDSVCFDFSRETITSYNQIRRNYKDFYALESARAFRALLNDVIGLDDQLIDVFVDLQAADRGFRYFANEKNRKNPILAIAAFLGNDRFSYHMSDLGRVYFAINTWLCFYGSATLSEEWRECPLCASPVRDGVCTNTKCKTKADEFLPILIELEDLVMESKKGVEIILPKYIKLIEPNAQFGAYKVQLTEIDEKRKKEKKKQEDKKKQADIALAEKELEKFIAKKNIEDGKENPDYDSLLQELASNKIIEAALQYDNKKFNQKIEDYKADIKNTKFIVGAQKDAERRAKAEQQKRDALDLAEKELEKFIAKKKIEDGKEKPNYDSLLQELKNNQVIEAAAQYNDGAFNQKIEAYKADIKNTKNAVAVRKEAERKAEAEKQKREAIDLAEKELEKFIAKKKIEDGKENPNYDSLLQELKNNQVIVTAAQYNDKTLNQKIEEFKADIRNTKFAVAARKEAERKAEAEKQKREAIDLAEKELEKFVAKKKIEDGKENPNYDSLLQELKNNQVIVTALQYNDKSLNQKIETLKSDIRLTKDAVAARKAAEKRAEAEKQKREALDLAEKELEKFVAKKKIEDGKENPNYDSLLQELKNNQVIVTALQYNDWAFNQKIEAYKTEIRNTKKTVSAQKEAERQAQAIKQKREAIDLAEKELEKFIEKKKIEDGKDSPNYDDLLQALKENKVIEAALQYDDKEFDKKVDAYKEDIRNAKRAVTARKEAERKAQAIKQKREAIDLAEKELEKFIEKKKIEDGKDDPNYDDLLQALQDNKVIEAALQYDDKEFDKKVDAYKTDIRNTKRALAAQKEAKKQETLAKEELKNFLMKKAQLDNEVINKVGNLSLTKLQELFKETDALYLTVSAFNTRLPSVYSAPEKQAILSYTAQTKPEAVKIIKQKELEYRLDKGKDALVALLGELKKELEKCKNAKDGAELLLERFTNEVEKNPEFIDCREHASWDALYHQFVDPVKKEIDEEYAKQTAAKKKQFQQAVDQLKNSVTAATPVQRKAAEFGKQLDLIKSNQYFNSIANSGEYKKEISKLEKQIAVLQEEENKFFLRRKIKRGAIIAVIVALLVFIYALFAYILPAGKLQFKTEALTQNGYVVTQVKEEKTEILEIEETLPHFFLQKNKKVVAVGEGAFQDNTYLKKCILPTTVEEIYANAFNGCVNLDTLILQSNKPPKLDETAFEACNTIFLVPQESYTAYMQSEDWAAYKHRIFPNYNNAAGYGTVMFDANGGSAVETRTSVQLNTLAEELPTPVRAGYVFSGWYFVNEEGKETLMKKDEAVFKNSTKLVAKWEQGVYSVRFHVNDKDDTVLTQEVVHGEKWKTLPSIDREGYTFDGWYLGEEKLLDSAIVSIVADAEVNARWTANSYSVVFEYNGSTPLTEKKTVVFDTPYGELPTPTLHGYIFAGWFCEKELVTAETLVFIGKDHTLTAQWTPRAYTIRFDANGGTVTQEIFSCEYDKEITIPLPTRTGYTFMQWEYEGGVYQAGDKVINLADSNRQLVFTAKWQANQYTVHYNADGGSVETESEACYYDQDLVLQTPTRKGYKFLYWSYASQQLSGGQVVNNLTSEANGEVSLRAIWQANTYAVEYDLQGGSLTHERVDCVYGVAFTLETPVREGYTFDGWLYEGKTYAAGESVSNLTADDGATIKLTALWHANENTLIFHANQGVGEMNSLPVQTEESVTLPKNTFTRAGYTFIGWSSQKDGGVEYDDGALYEMGKQTTSVLYACWQANLNTLIMYANNGTEDKLEFTHATDEKITLVKNEYTRKGYKFAGWALVNAEGVLYADEAAFVMPADEISYLVATWTANENVLIFDANGGEGVEVKQYIHSDEAKQLLPCTYTKEGYTFIGWSKNADGEVNYLDGAGYEMGTNAQETLYAVWQLNVYQITYEVNGGENSTENPTSYNVHSESLLLQNPEWKGYTFEGWYTDEGLTKQITEIAPTLLADVCVYAKWKANVNTLYFDANGGEGEMAAKQLSTGSMANLPDCTFEKVGYQFVGWSAQKNGGVAYFAGASYQMGNEAEYTLYAVWETVIYYVSYQTMGGANNPQNPSEYHVESEDIILQNPSKAGYTFGGWYVEQTTTTAPVEKIEKGSVGNKVFYAKWIATENTLRFNANGGTGSMESVTLLTGQTYALPLSKFTNAGYNFAGWSLQANGSSIYSDGASFEMGTDPVVTLYAVWTTFSYSISYNLAGGTNNLQNPSGYAVDSAKIVLSAPTKAGSTFVGWYKDAAYTMKITEIPTGSNENLILYAKWSLNTNTIHFNGNGGSGSMADMQAKTGETITLNKNAFTMVGYTFKGWATSKGGAVVYENGGSYTIGTNAEYTLYAVWAGSSYTVSYGGKSKVVTYGQPYGALEAPAAMAGYTFIGWWYNGNTVTASTVVTTASNHTLSAQWRANTYTVTAGDKQLSVTYGQAYGTLPTPTKTGYTFAGWTYNGNAITATTKVTTASNHTLTATWNVNYYKITISESGASVTVTVGSVVYATETSISVAYNSSIKVTFGSNYSNYKDLVCTFNGTSITSGSTHTMPAQDITISASSTEVKESCFAKGTLISLSNGTVKKVEDLKLGDSILSFDHTTGAFVEREIAFFYRDFDKTPITDLYFSNGSSLTIINMGHGLFNATLGKYVLVTDKNVQQFVGDSFVIADGVSGTLTTITLTSYRNYEAYAERYDIVTYGELNCFANNFLVCSDMLINVCNTFDFTEDFVYDADKMQQDVETYGVYTYEEWSDYMTEEEFLAFKGLYFKVTVEKGLITQEEILHLLWYLHSWN